MQGVWKLSFAARRGGSAAAQQLVPKRIRFGALAADSSVGLIEVPYQQRLSGRWQLIAGPPEASGAQSARFVLTSDDVLLLFDGLYDGERVAGTVYDGRSGAGEVFTTDPLFHPEAPWRSAADAAEHELGEFLCTRLFTFWGPPSPAASSDA